MKIEKIGPPKIIMDNPESQHRYFGWPSVARLQNGKIAAVASGYRRRHVCPFGKAVIAYSEDEGETYTRPAAVIDTPLDDRDADITTFGDKGVVITSFNNTREFQHHDRMTAAFAARVFGIDNVTAIKWTSPNFYQLASLKDMTHGEMTVINGPDEMMLSGLSAGADGAIGTTYNIQLDAALGVYNAFKNGNIAEAWVQQCRINRVVDVLKNYVTIPFTKVILEKQGYAVGNCVFPMKRYTEAEKDAMYAAYLEAKK